MKPTRIHTSTQSDGRTVALLLHGPTPWVVLETTKKLPLDELRIVLWVIAGDEAPTGVLEIVWLPPAHVHESLLPVAGVSLDDIIKAPAFIRAAVRGELME